MRTGCAKTAERIDVPFGVESSENPRNILLGLYPPHDEGRRFAAAFDKLLATY